MCANGLFYFKHLTSRKNCSETQTGQISPTLEKENSMAEEEGKTTVEGEENFIGTFKDKVAAEEGWANLEGKLASQGNELGDVRKQGETDRQTINDLQNQLLQSKQPTPEPAQDYGKELSAIQKDMAKLDPIDANYHKDLMVLMNKSNNLAAQAQHEKTLTAATASFTKELDERDVKATHNAFYKDNPDFNTPEMQARIKDYIAKDNTGMSDPLVAYREIQRDEAVTRATELETENAELKRLTELAKGTDQTGKVITKSQTASQVKQPKATGADLDKGMQAALEAQRA